MHSTPGGTGILMYGPGTLLSLLILLSGCTGTVQPPAVTGQVLVSPDYTNRSWMDVPLTDLQGKGNFSFGSFAGKSVVLLVVSDACPACVSQLSREIGEIERLARVQDGSIAFVALDLDPTGDPGFIAKYHDQFNFTGYTAYSPEEMTLQLLRTLGPFAIDTEAIPVILFCPDRHEVLLPPGYKSTETLDTLYTKEC